MSHHAAILCHTQGINTAAQTRQHFVKIFAGKVFNAMKTAAQSFQWRQSAQLALAVLRSLQCYVENGGGSRGAGAIYDGEAGIAPQTPVGHSAGVFGQKIRMPGNI